MAALRHAARARAGGYVSKTQNFLISFPALSRIYSYPGTAARAAAASRDQNKNDITARIMETRLVICRFFPSRCAAGPSRAPLLFRYEHDAHSLSSLSRGETDAQTNSVAHRRGLARCARKPRRVHDRPSPGVVLKAWRTAVPTTQQCVSTYTRSFSATVKVRGNGRPIIPIRPSSPKAPAAARTRRNL